MRRYQTNICLFVFVLLFAMLFSGCENAKLKNELTKAKLLETADHIFDNVNINTITDDVSFPTEIDGIAITWMSTVSEVLSDSGKVKRNPLDTEIAVYAFLTVDGMTISRKYIFTILGLTEPIPEPDPDSDPDPEPEPDPEPLLEYYRGAEGLSGQVLKSFLHNLIDDHQEYDYSFVKTALKSTDEDPNNPNNVILFYTGRSQEKSSYGTGIDNWNNEHVWAKSHGDFGTAKGPGTDLHHLRPTDSSVNSTRGNKDFDEGGNKIVDTYGFESSFCYSDSDSFEPRDEVKGDVARILFYMAVRYEGDVSGEPDLELNDLVNNGSAPYMGRLTVLLRWNQEDPVDDFERHRNEVIFGYQGNRNPFIDYPAFANLIWGN